MPEPGWFQDPAGRRYQRYFDGTRWTEHVADEYGRRGIDPLPSAAPRAAVGVSRAATQAGQAAATRSAAGVQVSLPAILAYGGAALTFISIVFLGWLDGSEATALGSELRAVLIAAGFAGAFGEEGSEIPSLDVWETSYFDAGWIVTLAVVVVAVLYGRRGRTATTQPWVSLAVVACALWAVIGSLLLKSWVDDLGGLLGETFSSSLSVGFYLGLVGMLAVAAAPFVPDTSRT
jgi:hypothetical protein